MRLAPLLALVSFAAVNAAAQVAPASRKAAEAVLTQARERLGGEAKLRGVKTVVLRGTLRSTNAGSGPKELVRSVEVRIKLPDRYIRIETDGRFIRRTGFVGERAVNEIRVLVADGQASASPGDLAAERAQCARLLLGLFADTRSVVRLQPATDNAATHGSVRLEGPEGFSVWLDVAAGTMMPVRVRYQDMAPAPPNSAGTASSPVKMPSLMRAEITESYDSRRLVSGLWLPHRITRAAYGGVLDEWTIDAVIVNAPLGPDDFR